MANNIITTHDENGKAVFSQKVDTQRRTIPMPAISKAVATEILYSTDLAQPDLSTEEDIDKYEQVRMTGQPPGQVCPKHGSSAILLTLGAGGDSPWHRTSTIDIAFILSGTMELHLDSGETKVLQVGDSVVQQGTMNKWKNVTPDGGEARMIGFTTALSRPVQIGSRILQAEWRLDGIDTSVSARTTKSRAGGGTRRDGARKVRKVRKGRVERKSRDNVA